MSRRSFRRPSGAACIDPAGYDAGKKINGKKRHAIVHAADIQDRDGGATLMATLFGAFPFLSRLFADGGYQGPKFKAAMKRIRACVEVEIVKPRNGSSRVSY